MSHFLIQLLMYRCHQNPRNQRPTICPLPHRTHTRSHVRSRRASASTLDIDIRLAGQDGTP
jgi:hypothetical protein